VKRLRATLASANGFGELVGSSPAMQRVYALLARVADSESSVLITGESGTGKELVARALHHSSPRHGGPFVAINCAAMPESLLESELFGHEKGAFTDARSARAGLFVQATGGTLFLDEIGDLPLALQPKLLRALQERQVRPVGGRKEVPFDVRIVAATNRDLETAIDEGRFREDLYFRIDVIEVALPPLRARGNDVLALAQNFLVRFSEKAGKGVVGLMTPVAKHLIDYDWPGNVRELHNVIERAVALATHDHITVDDLPEKVLRVKKPRVPLPIDAEDLVSLEEMERRYIHHVLEASGGSRTVAARTLGLDRSTLWRKLERLRISASKSTPES
jgi:transcriptional regulator with PAS, ATPase and Fis domain